jgi:hypothetical protein
MVRYMLVDLKSNKAKEAGSMKRFKVLISVCLLAVVGFLVGCANPVDIPAIDETPPSVGVGVGEGVVGESDWGIGVGDEDRSVTGTAGEEYPFVAIAEDLGGVKKLQVHIEGGEPQDTAVTNKHGDESAPVDTLLAGGNLEPVRPGQIVTLWAEAEDYNGNAAKTARLSIVVPATWQIRLERLRVADAQEEAWYSDGDEPYFIVIGFRSRLGTAGSTSAFWNGHLDDDWAGGVDDGDQKDIPERMGLVSFADVRPVMLCDDFDVSDFSGTAMPEFVGALVLAVEGDQTGWDNIEDMADDIAQSLEQHLGKLIEEELPAAGLLGATEAITATIPKIESSVKDAYMEHVYALLRDDDDIIGAHFFLFVAADPAVADSLPFPEADNATLGVLQERRFVIGSNPITFEGEGAKYEVTTSVTAR